MKRYLAAFFIFLVLFGSFPAKGFSTGEQEQYTTSDYQVIPDEAIRLRILANSDNEKDQVLKREIRDQVNEEITEWVEEITEIEQARQLIENRLVDIDAIVKRVLKEKGIDQDVKVEYGDNVQFPTKVYGAYVYPAGEYEAILITLGEGKGANWWCVLFPPLCFLDFSNGTSVDEEAQEEKKEEKEEPKEEEKKKKDKDEDDEEKKEVTFKLFFLDWFS
ncbi:stage II sporulation protein R [Aquibacillus rhizosphaerae]|uniref:Stage II sporulation protein R n=1 Tax=Aquibacillus rhizosphaerae TaxID=3051431 RepID=A0ABT7L034_9BACI|nr:stage II sporulation protein R [Aquibacillus sp. LR5S19]MDL4839163.1 stage II sporulation protein R [Aquibacillus sp. LR5S19]